MIPISEQEKTLKGYKFIDLFAGIGGFHYALKSFGAECVFASEIDEKASLVYEQNHGLKPFGDITQIDEKDIPKHDILCAGFPCQAFSISGKQKGFEDTRGTLFFDIARIVKEHQPKIVFLENVKNFVKHDKGNTLKIIQNTLENLGYVFFYKVLNTSDFGLPQNRERVYMICFHKDFIKQPKFHFPSEGAKTGLYKIGNTIRKLSPRECARLQGFPEDFKMDKSITQAHKQFGNSVSINVLQYILREVIKTINNEQRPTIRLTNSQEWIQERKRYRSEIQQLANG